MSSKPIRNQVQRLNLRGMMYFITTTTYRRQPIFDGANNVQLLRETMREAQKYYPFGMRGYVILPDHAHLLIQLKEDTDISKPAVLSLRSRQQERGEHHPPQEIQA